MDIAEEELHALYTWVDEIPLSRPKRNIARDFSDGVLAAEVVRHYFPKLVELHNYSPANSLQLKLDNWRTLNEKVFKRLGFVVPRAEMEAACQCVPGAVERVLKLMKVRMASYKSRHGGRASSSGKSPTGAHTGGSARMRQPEFSDASAGQWAQDSAPAAGGGPTAQSAQAAAPSNGAAQAAANEQVVQELRDTLGIMEAKVLKLEQLVRLKDAKISALTQKLQQAGIAT